MSIEIEVLNGNESWPIAEPLFKEVWPPEVVQTLPWAGIVFAHADLRVLVQTEAGEAACTGARWYGMDAGCAPAESAAF